MNKCILKSVFAVCWLMVTVPCLAYPEDPIGEDDPVYQDPMPIDNNAWLLTLIALVLGAWLLTNWNKFNSIRN